MTQHRLISLDASHSIELPKSTVLPQHSWASCRRRQQPRPKWMVVC